MKVFCVVVVLFNLVSSSEKAKKLHEVILHESGYNKVIRPVINASNHIDVRLGLKLSQLIDVVSSHFWKCIIIISHIRTVMRECCKGRRPKHKGNGKL